MSSRDFTNINNQNQSFINELNQAMGDKYKLTYIQHVVNHESFGENTVEYSVKFTQDKFTKTVKLYQTDKVEPAILNLDNIRYIINKSYNQEFKDDFLKAYEKISIAKELQEQFVKPKTSTNNLTKNI